MIPANFSRTFAPAITCALVESCGATLDTWANIGGQLITDLKDGTNDFTKVPNNSTRLTNTLEVPTNVGDNYGSRMKGWLRPPMTGEFVFWIASDDLGELWLSSDSDPENKERVCYTPGPVSRYYFTAYYEQKSKPIPLVAGRAYYYEVRDCVVFTS